MAKTLIDIDDDALEHARLALGTTTKRDTVNQALAEVAALAARRRDIDRLRADGLPDLRDPEVMDRAWPR